MANKQGQTIRDAASNPSEASFRDVKTVPTNGMPNVRPYVIFANQSDPTLSRVYTQVQALIGAILKGKNMDLRPGDKHSVFHQTEDSVKDIKEAVLLVAFLGSELPLMLEERIYIPASRDGDGSVHPVNGRLYQEIRKLLHDTVPNDWEDLHRLSLNPVISSRVVYSMACARALGTPAVVLLPKGTAHLDKVVPAEAARPHEIPVELDVKSQRYEVPSEQLNRIVEVLSDLIERNINRG